MDLQVHPLVAGIYPKMSSADFSVLCRSIKENGLREPITLYEGMILDGDHRYQACEVEGVELRTTDYTGDEPLKLVEDLNSHRRHLTIKDRKDAAARLLKADPTLSDRAISLKAGLSKGGNTVARVREDVNAQTVHKEEPDLTDDTESQQPIPDSAGSSSSAEDTGIVPAAAENPETGVRVPQASDTPKPRKEASGRKARGRKPGSGRAAKGTARNAALAAAAATTPAKLREQFILDSARLCKADCRQHGHDLVSMFVDCAKQFQEDVPEPTRRDWHQKLSEALGFRLTEGPVI